MIYIWVPPTHEHEAWREFTGATDSREEFLSRVSEVERQLQSSKQECEHVRWTVSYMKARLAHHGLSNTTEARAKVIGLDAGADRPSRPNLGMRITRTHPESTQACLGWALVDSFQQVKESGEAQTQFDLPALA